MTSHETAQETSSSRRLPLGIFIGAGTLAGMLSIGSLIMNDVDNKIDDVRECATEEVWEKSQLVRDVVNGAREPIIASLNECQKEQNFYMPEVIFNKSVDVVAKSVVETAINRSTN